MPRSARLVLAHTSHHIVQRGLTPNSGRQRYRKQIITDLTAGLSIKKKIVGQSILGSDVFVNWVRDTYLDSQKDREWPSVNKIHRYVSLEEVVAAVEKETGIQKVLNSSGTIRQIVMTSLYNYAGLNNREIGNLLGVDYSTVSQGRKRLRAKAEKLKRY